MSKVVRAIAREATKFGVGLAVSAGAGALAMGAVGLIPAAAVTGMGRIFAGVGAMGIGAWVSDSASEAAEKRVDTVWNIIDFFADGKKAMNDPRIKELMSIIKGLDKGEITPEEAKERLNKTKDNSEEAEETESEPETEEE